MKILLVFVSLLAVLQAQDNEVPQQLDPAVISHLNYKIDKMIQYFPNVYPPRNGRETELYAKLQELNSTKLKANATEAEEDLVLNAIINFSIYLKHLEELLKLSQDSETELLSLAKSANLNRRQSREVFQIYRALRQSSKEGSSEDIIEAIKNYESFKVQEIYGKDVEEEEEEEQVLQEEEGELQQEEDLIKEEESKLQEQKTEVSEENAKKLEREEEELQEKEEELKEEEAVLQEEETELENEEESELEQEEEELEQLHEAEQVAAPEQNWLNTEQQTQEEQQQTVLPEKNSLNTVEQPQTAPTPILKTSEQIGPLLHLLQPQGQRVITISPNPNSQHHIIIVPVVGPLSYKQEDEITPPASPQHQEYEAGVSSHHHHHSYHQRQQYPLENSHIHPHIIRQIIKALRENFLDGQ